MSNTLVVVAPATTPEVSYFGSVAVRVLGDKVRAACLLAFGEEEEEDDDDGIGAAADEDSVEKPKCSSISSSCRKNALTLFALVEGDDANARGMCVEC
jgi:hypothetical protein